MYAGGARSPRLYAAICSCPPRRSAPHAKPGRMQRGVVTPATGHIGPAYDDLRAASALAGGTCRGSVSNATISRDEPRRRTYGPDTACIQNIAIRRYIRARIRSRCLQKRRKLAYRMSTSTDMSAVVFPATVRQ